MNGPAIALIVYRRPELAALLVQALAPHRPKDIWVIADGPKNEGEAGMCREARQAVEGAISWPCRVRKVYAEKNLGLRRRVETGMDALFCEEKEAVILEEDCHPTADFLPFCAEMLARYRENPKVAGIAGNCFLPRHAKLSSSYFYSRFLHIWGWATWSRVWREYNRSNWAWPTEGITRYFPQSRPDEIRYWNLVYSRVASGQIDTWDYRWTSHLWSRGLCAVVPSQNLIRNRGFGATATNTRDEDVEVGIERELPLPFPCVGPGTVQPDEALDRMIFENHFLRTEGKKSLWGKLTSKLRKPLLRVRRR
jgi:hypothetical protein